MGDELENHFWKSFLEQMTAVEKEFAPEKADAHIKELQQVIDYKRAKIEKALAEMAAIVEFAEKRGLANANALRAMFDQVLKQEEQLNRLNQKADLVVRPPKREA
jgi:hypothetical protein